MSSLEAASTLNLHPGAIKCLCRQGKLRGEKVNSGWLISNKEIESFASTYEETRGRPANGRAQVNSEDAIKAVVR